MRMLILLTIITASLTYIGWHIWTMIPLPRIWKGITIAIFVLLFLLMPVTLLTERFLPLQLCSFLDRISTAWFIITLYVIIIFILTDISKCLIPSLRPFFAGSWKATGLIAVIVFFIFMYGNNHYHNKVRVPLNLTINKTLEKNYKIVFISDLHLGYTIGPKELGKWVDTINHENPDLILIGGDIIDFSMRPLANDEFKNQLQRLHAPLGVFSCLGNHEYYAQVDKSTNFFEKCHIKPLVDQSVLVDKAFYVIGRDDRTNRRRHMLLSLVDSLDVNRPIIVLDHQPYHLEKVKNAGIDLQLSGHTHRGQVFPINLITDYLYECSHGYLKKGKTHFYISSGIGIWGGKYRIGSQSEYVVINLSGQH